MIRNAKTTTFTILCALALALGPGGPTAAAAATSSQFANGWSSTVPVQWFPQPPSANVLGPPESPSMCVGASSTPCCADASFTFPNFSIPPGDTILGVEVNIKYETDGLADVVLTNGGSPGGDTKVLPINPGASTCDGTSFGSLGGAADTWSLTLTPADFNSGQIGFRLTQQLTTIGGGPGSVPIDIDAVELIVHHGAANTPPVAEAGGPYSGSEGSPVSLNGGSATDDGSIVLWEWDFDNDGVFDFSSPTSPNTSHTYPDNGSFTAVLRVTDDGGLTDADNATVTVANVAPTIALSGTPVPVDEGSPFSLTLGAITDPGTDTVTQWIVHWGDGTTDSYGSGGVQLHTYGDGPASPTIVVDLVDEDGTHLGAGSLAITVDNVAPTVAEPVVSPEPSDEGSPVTASATFSDPATDDSPFTCSVDYDTADAAVTPVPGTVTGTTCDGPSHSYGDNGTFTVEVCVTDKDGGEGCESVSHVVENVPPTVATPTFSPDPSDEGSGMTASATFTDPGEDDAPFTCTVDYDTADTTVTAIPGTVTGMTCDGPSYTYGDNGSFNVEICVTDKDGGEGCADRDHVVDNVAPDAQLDTAGAITFPSGEEAFLGRRGVEQSHDADGDDPGSDDLTFDWDFGFAGSGVSTTYYNDTGDPFGTPDPLPSPHGTFPFSASDTASVTFADLGVFTVRVDVTDDDGGSDFEQLPKLVTGDGDCAYSQGFWRHQFSQKGRPHFDSTTLQAFLDLVDFASGVFSEEVAAMIPAEAQAVFAPGGSFRDKATRQALAAWLNWAFGGVGWGEAIDIDGDLVPDEPFSTVIAMVEAILLNPDATHHELELAKDLAEAVNLKDALDPGCSETRPSKPPETH